MCVFCVCCVWPPAHVLDAGNVKLLCVHGVFVLAGKTSQFGSSSKHAEIGPESIGIVVCRFVGTVPDILGLVWPSFRHKSGSKSKIPGRILLKFSARGPQQWTLSGPAWPGSFNKIRRYSGKAILHVVAFLHDQRLDSLPSCSVWGRFRPGSGG